MSLTKHNEETNNEYIVQKVADMIISTSDAIKKLYNRLSNGLKVSLDEIQEIYAEQVDLLILQEEERSGNKYISGEFKLNKLNEAQYNCSYALYFQDSNEKFYEITNKSDPLPIKYLTDDVISELNEKGKIEFEMGEPSEESKAKYQELKNSTEKENK